MGVKHFGGAVVASLVLALSSPSAPCACTGDCGGDERVTVDELVVGVRLLQALSSAACSAFPATIALQDVVEATTAALAGCPLETPVATATPTPSTTPTATATSSTAAFVDVTLAAGLDYAQAHFDRLDPPFIQALYFTGGAAAGDYDGDGWIDLYVTRFDAPGILFRNRFGHFEDVTTEAGLTVPATGSNGAGWADVDNDGDEDLYVTALGPNQYRFYLFINDGQGHFTEEGIARGASLDGEDEKYGFSVSFGDYDRDGWLDLHTTEWRFDEDNPTHAKSNARLLRNRGAEAPGFFIDVTVAAGVAMDDVMPNEPRVSGTFSFSSTFIDLDNDGWQDLAIAADFKTSRLFWNNGDGTFTDGTVAAGVGNDENGMGSAIGDFDGDGLFDWFVTAIYDPEDFCTQHGFSCFWGHSGNHFYRNEGGRHFTDRTDEVGVRSGGWGWGASFLDFDHDADLDLVMTNGVRYLFFPSEAYEVFPYRIDPIRLWRNDGVALMPEIADSVGLTNTESGKGLLTLDYDRDGDLDLFVANTSAPPNLYRNDVARDGWLQVRAHGRDSNRDGIGARLRIRAAAEGAIQHREIYSGSQFLGQSERVAHFGLGAGSAPVAEVRIFWPATGREQVFHDVPRNTTLDVTEPAD